MSEDSPKGEESAERVAELEQEVARLKEQLEQQGEDARPAAREPDQGAVEAVRRLNLEAGEEDLAAAEAFVPNKTRQILIGVLVGMLALGAMLLLTSLISSGFGVAAKKAATFMYPDETKGNPAVRTVPDDDDDERAPLKPLKPRPRKAEPAPIRAPGL